MARKLLREKQNIIKCANWNIRVIAHKEELDSVLRVNKKQIKIAAITE
jgi:hypothetical protein